MLMDIGSLFQIHAVQMNELIERFQVNLSINWSVMNKLSQLMISHGS